jgi:glucose/arabinose dehydrogenase
MTSQPRADGSYKRLAGSRARRYLAGGLVAGGVWFAVLSTGPLQSQVAGPAVFDPNLAVATVVSGLSQPTSMAFIGRNDIFVLEKASGKVQRVINGMLQATPALDLAVNSNSERGLLGIALHPRFPRNPRVYLYWTESTAKSAAGAPIDTTDAASTPLLGNRVDSFVWNGTALTWERNLIRLHAFQADAGQPLRGNHNGGVIRFELSGRGDDDDGHGDRDGDDDRDDAADHGDHRDGFTSDRHDGRDGQDGDDDDDNDDDHGNRRDDEDKAKLFIIIGDNGRRGQTQNLENGPFGPGIPDDQFGGPEPDNAHLTGVVLRLNDDGTTPRDNPFFRLGRRMGGEVGANIQRVFAYGIRNSFGMAVDPRTGHLWNQENGDDSFDEINRISPGQNNGWVQLMGPVSRVTQFKMIETSPAFFGLQQIRWPPTNIADTPAEALARLFMLRGAHYRDPQFSWKYAIAPAGIGFQSGRALGRQYDGDLFVGAARTFLDNGYLLRFNLSESRRSLALSDPRLADRVADNAAKFDATESETLRFGTGFGVGTDIQTGPNGNLFVVSLSNGSIYEIRRTSRPD